MVKTSRPISDWVVRSVCGRDVERVVRLTGGGMNETYRVQLPNEVAVVARIARLLCRGSPTRSTSWRRRLPLACSTQRWSASSTWITTASCSRSRSSDSCPAVRSTSSLVSGRPRISSSSSWRVVNCRQGCTASSPTGASATSCSRPRSASSPGVRRTPEKALGPAAAAVVERGARLLREEVMNRTAPTLSLTKRNLLPKNLLIDDGAIVGVTDWECAGPASPAFDLAVREGRSTGTRESPMPIRPMPAGCPPSSFDSALEKTRLEQPRSGGAVSGLRGRDRRLGTRVTNSRTTRHLVWAALRNRTDAGERAPTSVTAARTIRRSGHRRLARIGVPEYAARRADGRVPDRRSGGTYH